MPEIPGQLKFPAEIDTVTSLFEVKNDGVTSTSSVVAADATLIPVEANNLPNSGAVRIDYEIIYYTARTATALGTSEAPVLRGQAGTAAAPHADGTPVRLLILAEMHEVLRDAIIQLEMKMGKGISLPSEGYYLKGTADGRSAWADPSGEEIQARKFNFGSGRVTIEDYGINGFSRIGGTDNVVFGDSGANKNFIFQNPVDMASVNLNVSTLVWPSAFTLQLNNDVLSVMLTAPSKAFAVQGASGQSANLQEWRNSTGARLAWLGASGYFRAGRDDQGAVTMQPNAGGIGYIEFYKSDGSRIGYIGYYGAHLNFTTEGGNDFAFRGGNLSIVDGSLYVGGLKAIVVCKSGWTLPNSTLKRNAADYSTLTDAEVRQVLAAIVNDLHAAGGAHGLIGA